MSKSIAPKQGYPIVAAGPQPSWEQLVAAFGRHPFALYRSSSEKLGGTLDQCRELAPCTLVAHYDFLMDEDRKTEFLKFLQMDKLVSVLIQLPEEKPDEALGFLLQIGCMGFLASGLTVRQMRRAVRSVRAGEIWAPRKLLSAVLQNRHRGPRSLTARESEILSLVAQGLSNRQISDALHITRETVRWNMRMVYGKLGVHDRQSLVLRTFGMNLPQECGKKQGRETSTKLAS